PAPLGRLNDEEHCRTFSAPYVGGNAVSSPSDRARKLQQEAFLFDGLLAGPPSPALVDRLLEIGFDSANWTVGGHADSSESLLQKIATYYWLRDAVPDKVHLVTSGADLDAPEHQGKLRVIMGIQGVEPIGKKFHFISILHALGLRLLQLTYNDANAVGNGCLEPDDRGLTHFGIQLVREANRLGMIV